MGCKLFLAVMTLSILFSELYYLCLQHLYILVNVSYEIDLYPDSLAVRLSPDKLCLFYLRFPKPFDLLE